MKHMKQFLIILTVSFLGEALHALLPLPLPASIYGLLIMLFSLQTGIIPLDSVKNTSMFLIEIMPIMFIPAAVELLDSWNVLAAILIPVLVITLVSTILVMAVSGRITQAVMNAGGTKK